MRKLKIKDRKRFERVSYLLETIIDTVLIIGILLIFIFLMMSIVKADNTVYENYIVTSGETLWSIASENKKDGQDVREYIYELQEINNIGNCMIYSGQEIKIIK